MFVGESDGGRGRVRVDEEEEDERRGRRGVSEGVEGEERARFEERVEEVRWGGWYEGRGGGDEDEDEEERWAGMAARLDLDEESSRRFL